MKDGHLLFTFARERADAVVAFTSIGTWVQGAMDGDQVKKSSPALTKLVLVQTFVNHSPVVYVDRAVWSGPTIQTQTLVATVRVHASTSVLTGQIVRAFK